jgi:hypothetical protein
VALEEALAVQFNKREEVEAGLFSLRLRVQLQSMVRCMLTGEILHAAVAEGRPAVAEQFV